MTSIDWDFDGEVTPEEAEANIGGGGGNVAPPGKYTAVITETEVRTTPNGTTLIGWEGLVVGGEHDGKRVPDGAIWEPDKSKSKDSPKRFRELMVTTTGLPLSSLRGLGMEELSEMIVGRYVYVTLDFDEKDPRFIRTKWTNPSRTQPEGGKASGGKASGGKTSAGAPPWAK